MPVAKLKAADSTDVLKSEEPSDSLDTFISQAIGKEPFFSFSRPGESPVQWIQLLHALDQQGVPGWPLLTPLKIQMQKCDKCSREFCSPINYRRHIRVHHRLKKLDKDSLKNRDFLSAYWDKLSIDESKEVSSFKDLALEEVPGSSLVKALTTLIRQPVFSALPQVCLRAGSAILDIIQARPSRFPITSEELFSVLDDASEKTFLCGNAISMQKFIFDGEAGKIGLETRNLVACASFMLEQKLVKAWLADKDAEALRCQKLLVEEEEATQRRQAELLERKRQKKLRQKEQKAKEQRHDDNPEVKGSVDDMPEATSPAETSSPLAVSDSELQNPDTSDLFLSSNEPVPSQNNDGDVEYEFHTVASNGCEDPRTIQNVERRKMHAGRRHLVTRWQAPSNGFHASQNSHASKYGSIQRYGSTRERVAPLGIGNKMWSRKPKQLNDVECMKTGAQKEATYQQDQDNIHEVLIGSISVTLECGSQEESKNAGGTRDACHSEDHIAKDNIQEMQRKPDASQYSANGSMVKFWRPVSRHVCKDPVSNSRDLEAEVTAENGGDPTALSGGCRRSVEDSTDGEIGIPSSAQKSAVPDSMPFNSQAAKAFLAQRWKEAIGSEHVKLVLSPEFDSSGQSELKDGSDSLRPRIVEHGMAKAGEASIVGPAKVKFRPKPERGAKIKYIPKQRSVT